MENHLLVQDIFIYPIKSLGGIRLMEADVEERGFRYDRRWMLVDAEGVFVTQRVYPQSVSYTHLTLPTNREV